MADDNPKIAHPRLPRPAGDGWELDPDGDWWRWEPPPSGGWPKGETLVFTRADLLARLRPNGEPPPLVKSSAKRKFIVFVPAEWTPAQEAFTRMIAVVGSGLIAARDLQHDLRADQLKAAVRWRTFEDGWEACELLKPLVWQVVRVRTRHWSDWKTIEISPGPTFEGHSVDYYVSRADLERRYPLLSETSQGAAPPTAVETEQPLTPQRRRGRSPLHDWHMVDGEIARRCHDLSGRLAVPEKESPLVDEMIDWYVKEKHRHMSPSTMRDAVRKVCAQLREKPATPEKSRPRKPSR